MVEFIQKFWAQGVIGNKRVFLFEYLTCMHTIYQCKPYNIGFIPHMFPTHIMVLQLKSHDPHLDERPVYVSAYIFLKKGDIFKENSLEEENRLRNLFMDARQLKYNRVSRCNYDESDLQCLEGGQVCVLLQSRPETSEAYTSTGFTMSGGWPGVCVASVQTRDK